MVPPMALTTPEDHIYMVVFLSWTVVPVRVMMVEVLMGASKF